MLKTIATIAALAILSAVACGCTQRVEDTAEYKAACEGPPLHGAEAHEKAMVEGYTINRVYGCIDKASFAEVAAQKAAWDAAHTPEAIAKQQTELAERNARAEAERQARAVQDAQRALAEPAPVTVALHPVDVNTASEGEIAKVISIDAQTAAEIVAKRKERRFAGWPDLVHRVVALSAAQTAVFASVCGLTVDGKSLDGAPPDAAMAAALSKRYSQYR